MRRSYGSADGADALVVITEWDAFRAPDLARLKSVMRGDVLVNLRDIYDPATRARGFAYHSIGR